MNANRVCWSRAAVDFATQVDVGGLEIDDPRADVVFRAIHQSLPVRRMLGDRTSTASEDDVLRAFARPIDSNEPLLLFVTGEKGTGKSHLVRWLKSRIGTRPAWHVVYIEKRNTSLRRVTEQILTGIDSPKAEELRQQLRQASSEIASEEEAMSALLARLDQLVTFDPATEIQALPEVSAAELADLRRKAHRLLGDFTFREEISQAGGPVQRIVRLARGGAEPSEDVDEADLRLTEADMRVDPSSFDELGPEIQGLVGSLVSNRSLRTDIAALCDFYLPRAKMEVFIGQGADLLGVFEDVRKEIASRGLELCLLIEDMVLLHGIDKQLAQALTVPATARLCKLRAAIAVTSGYLRSLDTFTDRGIQFTLDIGLNVIGQQSLRDFAGRYLNAGRLSDEILVSDGLDSPDSATPNACLHCPDRKRCHSTFGVSGDGYGLYPFNAVALDRLINLASPGDFQPRKILREVIRTPLEIAEDELPSGGTFPSGQFARTLDDHRQNVAPAVRAAIARLNQSNPEAELSLRSFYAQSPPAVDPDLERIAQYFGDQLTARVVDDLREPDHDDGPEPQPKARKSGEIDQWANGTGFLTAPTANRIRRWICEAVITNLQGGPYGLVISRPRGSRAEWRIGSHLLRATDVWIERAQGGGAIDPANPFRINATDENAVLLRGILTAADGDSLDSWEQGRWYFYLQTRISNYADMVARLAVADTATALPAAVQALEVLRYAAASPGQTVREALTAMLAPLPRGHNPVVQGFVKDVRPLRDQALIAVRSYATAAKGNGKPTLLDVGVLYRDIQSRLKTRSVEGRPGGDGEESQLLWRLQVVQARASELAWAEVARAVRNTAQFIDPDEDLAATLKVIDRLVKEAHLRGRLPHANSLEIYDEVRTKVDVEMMEIYRRLGKKIASGTGPGDLWDVLDDPIPQLTALRRYAALADQLLSGLGDSLVGGQDDGVIDTDALIEEFRELANRLDDVVNREGR